MLMVKELSLYNRAEHGIDAILLDHPQYCVPENFGCPSADINGVCALLANVHRRPFCSGIIARFNGASQLGEFKLYAAII